MSVKNLWSLTPGEAVVAWEAKKHGFHVFFPIKDIGVDLIFFKEEELKKKGDRRAITVQVKSSRFWEDWKDGFGGYGGWFKLSYKKLSGQLNLVDFYIFVLFHSAVKKGGGERFERKFFIISSQELIDKISKYHKGGDMINMYLRIFDYNGKEMVVDFRGISKKNLNKEINNPYRDYKKYLNNWSLLRPHP